MVDQPLIPRAHDFSHTGKDKYPWTTRFRRQKTVGDPLKDKDKAEKPAEKPVVTSFIAYKPLNEQFTTKTTTTDTTSTEQDASAVLIHRVGMPKAKIQQAQDEKNRSILATINTLLEKQAADISHTKNMLLKSVEQTYEAFTGYPAKDKYDNVSAVGQALAKLKDITTRLRNEALAFIAADTEEYDITKTSAFQKLKRLFSQRGTNTKGCLNETERYRNSLARQEKYINDLPGPVNDQATKQKIANYAMDCTKQIEIAHQRELDLEEQLIAYEKIEKQLIAYKGEADDYQAPKVRDTARQASERANQAKERGDQASTRAAQALRRYEDATSRSQFNIDPELSKASANAATHAKNVEDLERLCELQANDIFNFAKNKAAELEKILKRIL